MPRTVTPARVPTGRGAADHSDHDSHCDTVSAAPVAGPRGRTVARGSRPQYINQPARADSDSQLVPAGTYRDRLRPRPGLAMRAQVQLGLERGSTQPLRRLRRLLRPGPGR